MVRQTAPVLIRLTRDKEALCLSCGSLKLSYQAALANTGRALDRHDTRLALEGCLEPRPQDPNLDLSPDEPLGKSKQLTPIGLTQSKVWGFTSCQRLRNPLQIIC
jgi:hypothetical protein